MRIAATLICVAAVLVLFAVMSALTDFPLLDTMWRASAPEIHDTVSTLTVDFWYCYSDYVNLAQEDPLRTV